jgi:type I restriction enzyme R subunit
MSAEARELFAAFIPDGDVGRYARELPSRLRADFVAAMQLLRNRAFQDLLVNYPRPKPTFIRATEYQDLVSSVPIIRDGAGHEHTASDYIEAFARFVSENPAQIGAIRILLSRPREWSAEALTELRQKLGADEHHFSEPDLRRAHEVHYRKALVDIISMVKHAADAQQPLLTAAERIERAFATVMSGKRFTAEQQAWLGRIREHLRENLSIEREDFDTMPIFTRQGGWTVAKRLFGPPLEDLLRQLNEAIAA